MNESGLLAAYIYEAGKFERWTKVRSNMELRIRWGGTGGHRGANNCVVLREGIFGFKFTSIE